MIKAMMIFCQSLKKCLICSLFSVLFILFSPQTAFSLPLTPSQSIKIRQEIRKDLALRKSAEFEKILRSWTRRYGSKAVEPLLNIAKKTTNDDTDRYISIMGIAKTGGKATAPLILPFLKDPSWMVRNASLRALMVLNNRKIAVSILPLLNDQALVVRNEAVLAVEKLRPRGALKAILATLDDQRNYRSGFAQWVPYKSLDAVVKISGGKKSAIATAKALQGLLSHKQDTKLLAKTVVTLELLTGIKLKEKSALKDKVEAWKIKLASL